MKKRKWRWLLLPLSPIAIPVGFLIGIALGLRRREPIRFEGKFGYLGKLGEVPSDGDELEQLGEIPPDGDELEQLEEMTTDSDSKWRDCSVPDDFQDVLLAEVELSKGAPEYFICIIDDNGMMVDPDTGDDFGWDYSCISRWVPFDEILTWLSGRGEES